MATTSCPQQHATAVTIPNVRYVYASGHSRLQLI
jgi:hypothetical protein